MINLHLSQAGFIKPILERMSGAGIGTDRLLKSAGLDRFRISNPDSYIPVKLMYTFFDEVARYIGSDQLAVDFAEQYRLENIGTWGAALANCPNILSACQNAQKYDSHYQTNQRIRFEIDKEKAILSNVYIDPPSQGRTSFELLSICVMLDGFRLASDRKWAPLEIHFRGPSLYGMESVLPTSQAIIRFNQPSLGIVFPTAYLAARMKNPIVKATIGDLAEPATTLIDKLFYLFDFLKKDHFRTSFFLRS